MIFHCEYCGSVINPVKDKKCPHCGASYDSNLEYKSYKKTNEETEKLNIEEKKLDLEERKIKIKEKQSNLEQDALRKKNNDAFVKHNNQRKQQRKITSWVAFIVLLPFITSFIIAGGQAVKELMIAFEGYAEDYEEEISTPILEVSHGSINEYVKDNSLNVLIDEIEEIDGYPFTPADGYYYINVHFVVENLTDKSISIKDDNIHCLADDIVVEQFWASGYKHLDGTSVPNNMKADGYVAFEIPMNASNYRIVFGDYIDISFNESDIIKLEN